MPEHAAVGMQISANGGDQEAREVAPYVQIYTSLFAAKSKRIVLKTTIKSKYKYEY